VCFRNPRFETCVTCSENEQEAPSGRISIRNVLENQQRSEQLYRAYATHG